MQMGEIKADVRLPSAEASAVSNTRDCVHAQTSQAGDLRELKEPPATEYKGRGFSFIANLI